MTVEKHCRTCRFSFFRESAMDVVCIRPNGDGSRRDAMDLPKERICEFWSCYDG